MLIPIEICNFPGWWGSPVTQLHLEPPMICHFNNLLIEKIYNLRMGTLTCRQTQ